MTDPLQQPFSARNRREKHWIEQDFPASARSGLLHLLGDAIDRGFVSGWHTIAKELRRIARANHQNYDPRSVQSIQRARTDAETYLIDLSWERAYDFCERIHSRLAEDAIGGLNGDEVVTTKAEAQLFLAEEIQRLFDEEGIGYEFRDGFVQRRGKRHTVDQIGKAEKTLADFRLAAARKHFSKALRHFRDREKPDLENAVKEAVCAVEAAAKELFPEAKANTLGDFINWATSKEHNIFPKSIGNTLTGLYTFRNSGEGVSHGGTTGGTVTTELCEYVLGIAASQVLLLAGLSKDDEEPPF
jgi:AbiJ N-terminal domain 4